VAEAEAAGVELGVLGRLEAKLDRLEAKLDRLERRLAGAPSEGAGGEDGAPMPAGGRLLTVDDLARRWSCEPATVLSMVRARKVPYIQTGNRKPLDARGPKDLRFRLAGIERWEAEQEMTWTTPEAEAAEARKRAAAAAAYGWTAPDHTGRPSGGDRSPGGPAAGPGRRRAGGRADGGAAAGDGGGRGGAAAEQRGR
jgi:hypothetical protein